MVWEYAVTLFYLLLGVSGVSLADSDVVKCGTTFKQPASLLSVQQLAVGKRIVGGREATPGSWPWMVMLKKNDEAKCAGSILNKYFILTAAHCLYGEIDLKLWKVFVGKYHKYSTDNTERIYTIHRVILHEKFSSKTLNNDIALLVLEYISACTKAIRFTDYVTSVCLPPPTTFDPNASCFTTGWGETKGTGHDDVLKEVLLEMKNPFICSNFLRKIGKSSIRRQVFCAGRQDADACYGDSGGPYSCINGGQWYIKGVVSFGRDCGQPGWYGIYVNVSRYVKWINWKMAMPLMP